MAYQLFYYLDLAMTRRAKECDEIADGALHRFTPPKNSREVVTARHSDDRTLSCYGYQGAWHDKPPREAAERDTPST
jgi:hypothetical protein